MLWDEIGPYLAVAAVMLIMATMEWVAVLRHTPRLPWLYTGLAVVACLCTGWKLWQVRTRLQQLKLGRDGERAVGQYLERLRTDGADVFHDVPGEGFNVDHVVLSVQGFYAVETKTRSKPCRAAARVALTEKGLLVNGFRPDRDPLMQAQAGARWLSQLLEETTGKRFPVRGVVLFPGWFVEPMSSAWRMSDKPWVLEPKALPAFIKNEPKRVSDTDMKLAAYHLSRYVRVAAKS